MTEINTVHNQWTYTNSGRVACQDFSFTTVLGERGLPKFGDRLKDEIDRLGLSYNEFGATVAENERPPRKTPYRKNNVEHWVASRRNPNQFAWAAIERVTGKALAWFLHGDLPDFGERAAVFETEPQPPLVAPDGTKRKLKGSG